MNNQNYNTNYNPLEKGNNSTNNNLYEIEDGEIITDLIKESNKVNLIYLYIFFFI
jgi:hypothetical protein